MSAELIDAQFDRAVEIVQGLPKTGPIQTDYEEKLTMYSLYKQATCGNVRGPRPGIWDMLGRAKWDAWAKHKNLDPLQAKWLYVEALLKVLRKYSDKTIAKTLVEELESYGGDPSNIVLSRHLSTESESSGSTASEEDLIHQNHPGPQYDSGVEEHDEPGELPLMHVPQDTSQAARPQSAMSSRRYRTPMADSLAMSPPPPQARIGAHSVPATQPMPGFETPSAFAEPSPISAPSSLFPTSSYVGQFSQSSQAELTSPPPEIYPSHPIYPGTAQPIPRQFAPVPRVTLERAVENVQAQIAALSERLESLETLARHSSRSHISLSSRGVSSPVWGGRSSPFNGQHGLRWDIEDLGMWSYVLEPVSRGIDYLRELAKFLAKDDNRSPSMIILRRLCLDASFLICVLGFIRLLWKKSGVRRREVYAALIVLWRAIMGTKPPPRRMVDRGV